MPPLDWIAGTPERDGHIASIEFSADITSAGTWDIQLWAC
jgi:hypothetical protein